MKDCFCATVVLNLPFSNEILRDWDFLFWVKIPISMSQTIPREEISTTIGPWMTTTWIDTRVVTQTDRSVSSFLKSLISSHTFFPAFIYLGHTPPTQTMPPIQSSLHTPHPHCFEPNVFFSKLCFHVFKRTSRQASQSRRQYSHQDWKRSVEWILKIIINF